MSASSFICPVCKTDQNHSFFELTSTPTQDGIMAESKEEAINTLKGDILLRYCRSCDYIWNQGHSSDKVQFDQYDFSLDHSPAYRQYLEDLTSNLIEKYNLRNKKVVEIGCGQGDFLKLLCRKGENRGIGIDPGFVPEQISDHSNCQFLREYYSPAHADLKPDLIVCRLVIDLLTDPFHLLATIAANIEERPDTLVYFEIFDAEYTFRKKVIWNVVYEHRSWLTQYSIPHFFDTQRLKVLALEKLWHGEYYGVMLKAGNGITSPTSTSSELLQITNEFKFHTDAVLRETSLRLKKLEADGVKIVAWGAGARAVTFFNIFKTHIAYIVDVNPLRHDKYLPGGGQKIVAPQFLKEYMPDLIIITNPTYAEEIKAQVLSLKLRPDFWIL